MFFLSLYLFFATCFCFVVILDAFAIRGKMVTREKGKKNECSNSFFLNKKNNELKHDKEIFRRIRSEGIICTELRYWNCKHIVHLPR